MIIRIAAILLMLIAACTPKETKIPEDKYEFFAEGKASWYGKPFQGRSTASGEIYDTALLTAAHRTLPFGTILKVTNKYTSKTVIVKVNDRGPFHKKRILDLSKQAAKDINMIHAGVVDVLIEKKVIHNTSQKKP